MSLYPLNPTPNRVRNLEAYVAHAEAAATTATAAAQTVTDQVAAATTQAQNAAASAQAASAAAAGTFILRGDATQNFTDPQIAQFWTNLQLNKSFLRGDVTQSFTDAQIAQLLANLQIGQLTFGQCQFSYVSPTQCVLKPVGGGLLTVNQMPRVIPSAGIPFSNALSAGGSNLAINTVYYAYVYWTGTALTWEFSTTVFTLDSRGQPVKTGDATRTCVGGVYTTSSGLFKDDSSYRGVGTYFNRVSRPLAIPVNSSASINSTTPISYTTAVTCLTWGDSLVSLNASGYNYCNTALGGTQIQLYLDGVAINTTYSVGASPSANGWVPAAGSYSDTPGLGAHTFTPYAFATAAGSACVIRTCYNGGLIS